MQQCTVVVLLHNKKELRSSCGVISWQVMEHPSKPYRIAGKGLRYRLRDMRRYWYYTDSVAKIHLITI
jgi:hypothetical protein